MLPIITVIFISPSVIPMLVIPHVFFGVHSHTDSNFQYIIKSVLNLSVCQSLTTSG